MRTHEHRLRRFVRHAGLGFLTMALSASTFAFAGGPRHTRHEPGGHAASHRHTRHAVVVHGHGPRHHGPSGHRRARAAARHVRHRVDYGRFVAADVHDPRIVTTTVVAPRWIGRPSAYRDFRYGRVYHRGHAHWHTVYVFPVRAVTGVVWTPYDYCDGTVHASGFLAFDGPRFHVSVGF